MKVNAAQAVCIGQSVQHIINPGKWILVKPCLLVQGPIINTHPKGATLFPSKKDGGPLGRGAVPDPAIAEVLI